MRTRPTTIGRRPELSRQRVEDLIRYRDHPTEFFADQWWIPPKPGPQIDPSQTLVPLRLNRQQQLLHDCCMFYWDRGKPVRLLVLKHRQWGCTTWAQAFMGWGTLFVGNSNAAIIAQSKPAVLEVSRKFKIGLENIDSDIRPEREPDNAEMIELHPVWRHDFRPRIMTSPAESASFGRGSTIRFLHGSEVPYWPDHSADSLMLGINQAIPPHTPYTWIVLEGTSSGPTGLFYDLWCKSVNIYGRFFTRPEDLPEDVIDFVPLFFPWLECEWYTAPASAALENGLADWRLAKMLGDKDRQEVAAQKAHLGRGILGQTGLPVDDPEEYEYAADDTVSAGQIAWRRQTTQMACKADPDAFGREYPRTPEDAWRQAGLNVFDPILMAKLIERAMAAPPPEVGLCVMEMRKVEFNTEAQPKIDRLPQWLPSARGDVKVYEPPQDGVKYLVFADVSQAAGGGADSAAHVLRMDNLDFVATIRCRVNEHLYGDKLFALATWYHTCVLAPEVTGCGNATVLHLIALGYQNLYRRPIPIDGNPFVRRLDDETAKSPFGWETSNASRPVMIAKMQSFLSLGLGNRIRDLDTLQQMQDWVRDKKGRPCKAAGKKDDLVMAACGAVTLRDQIMGPFPTAPSKPPTPEPLQHMMVAFDYVRDMEALGYDPSEWMNKPT